MEQRKCQVLRLHLQPLQSLLAPLQVQQVEADCSNVGEHFSGEQIRDQEVAGWAESTGKIYNLSAEKHFHFFGFEFFSQSHLLIHM